MSEVPCPWHDKSFSRVLSTKQNQERTANKNRKPGHLDANSIDRVSNLALFSFSRLFLTDMGIDIIVCVNVRLGSSGKQGRLPCCLRSIFMDMITVSETRLSDTCDLTPIFHNFEISALLSQPGMGGVG